MSQTKLLPRPPFWKVPDYIHDTDHRDQYINHPTSSYSTASIQHQYPHCHSKPTKGLLKTRRSNEKCKKRVRFKDNLVEYDDDQVDYSQRLNNVSIFVVVYSSP